MLLLCFKIFLARIFDVTLGTVRTMFVVKGSKFIAALIAFVEVIIWFFAAKEALNTEIESLGIVVSYAAGYATGTFIGTLINEIFITGIYNIQVISFKIDDKDIAYIKKNNFGVSVINSLDQKKILFLEINKKRYKECLKILKECDPESFIVVSESKIAYNGYIMDKK